MSDLDDETDTSCGEEQNVPDWEVSEEWLQDILTKNFQGRAVKIMDFVVNPGWTIDKRKLSSTSESALSSITSVKTHFTVAQTLFNNEITRDKHMMHMIIKRLPKDPFSRFFVTEGQFDLREINFYTKIVPDLREFNKRQLNDSEVRIILNIPKCVYANYTPASGTDENPVPSDSILVLDNVRDNQYYSVEFSRGLTLDEAECALKSIACIHAHSLSLKIVDGKSLPECYPFLFQTTKATDSYQQLVERGLPQLMRFLKRKPGMEVILKALLVLRPRTKDIISALLAPEGPLALITHTDFWSNNLFFKDPRYEGPKECCILDWQMVAYSRATNDIALLLVSSVSAKIRRKCTSWLLDKYWEKLLWTCSYLGLSIPKDLGYTREDLDKDYRKSQLLALLLCIGSVDVALGNLETEQRLIDVLKDLYQDGILTDETIIATNEANP